MADYNELTYKNVAMGVATVALTTSNLDASVVSFNFGASGVEVPHSTSTQTENNGTQQFFAFGFNLTGDYTASKEGFNAIDADHTFFAKRYINTRSSTTAQPLSGYLAKASQLNGFPKVAGFTSGPIGPDTPFTGDKMIRLYDPSATTVDQGPLAGIGRGGLALRFATDTEGEYRYGWADITINSTNFTIHGFGLETTPDTAIEYGAVPEVKQSALLLGLGAMGIAALRKRKQNVA
jgi:hypothetical protein